MSFHTNVKTSNDMVGFLRGKDATLFVSEIARDYLKFVDQYERGQIDVDLLIIAQEERVDARKELENGFRDNLESFFENGFQCDPLAIGNSIAKITLRISNLYATYKNEPTGELFLSVMQGYADIISEISKLVPGQRATIAFLLNIVVKNGYFNFLLYDLNSRIKVLRNMREHHNIVYDIDTFNSNIRSLAPRLRDIVTVDELKEKTRHFGLLDDDRCIVWLFDKSKNGKVNFLIEEKPAFFLKKLVTLCHILMFVTRMNSDLVLSRELYETYWQRKHICLRTIKLSLYTKEEHRKNLQRAVDASKAKEFTLPALK